MTIYFYKVSEPYGCFSNFSAYPIYLKGHLWPTSEHYYQAQKFLDTPEEALVSMILSAFTPEAAAAIGRDPRHKIRCDWDQIKNQVMHEAVRIKFLTHLDIQAILLATGDREIIEDSPTDPYWGCGVDRKGQNQLGKILMLIREEIRTGFARLHLRS